MPKASADTDLAITDPELRQIVTVRAKATTSRSAIKPKAPQVQEIGDIAVRYALTSKNDQAPVMLTISFTPDPERIKAIKLVPIHDVNGVLANAASRGGEWQATYNRKCLIQRYEDNDDGTFEELVPIAITVIAVENGISCAIKSKYFTLTTLYRNKIHKFETFSYIDLSDKKKGKYRQRRPQEDWPDPDKPRYANVNRRDARLDTRIENRTAERLDAFLEDTGMSKKEATDTALNRLIDEYELEHGIEFIVSEPE